MYVFCLRVKDVTLNCLVKGIVKLAPTICAAIVIDNRIAAVSKVKVALLNVG